MTTKTIQSNSRDATTRAPSPLNKFELTSIQALLAYTAHDKNVSETLVREALATRFGVDDVQKLPSQAYDEAIRFLVDIQVELILH